MTQHAARISLTALAEYLTSVLGEPVAVQGVRALGATDAPGDPKGFGYGAPFEVVCEVAGRPRTFVVSRTRPAAGFGHDYPADRAWQALYGHAAYNTFPRHVKSLDVGMVRSSGALVSAADVEAREEIEHALVTWRWRLRDRAHRCARVHGDFHPWNILFSEGTEFAVLDRSRGEWGEPADDVAALAVNYLFFGIRRNAGGAERGVAEPFRTLFQTFLATYLEASRDYELLETLPPFFAFRALVLAHPRWYPDLASETRAELLHFARCMAEATRFDPADLSWICGVAR